MSRQELADACNVELVRMRAGRGDRQRWAGLTEKAIGALERGEVRWPNDEYRSALCIVLQADARSLGLYIDRPSKAEAAEPLQSAGAAPSDGPFAGQGLHGSNDPTVASTLGPADLAWRIDQSADVALAFASVAAAGLDGQSTEDLFRRVADLAQGYASHDRWQTFDHARYFRDLAFEQATRTKRPDNLADLYLLSALNSLLMASAAFDLGRTTGALRLAQAARTLAGLSRHPEAEAWSVGLIATLFNWQNRPHEALEVIGRADHSTSGGRELFRLRHIQARSFALLGSRSAVARALAEAQLFLADANATSLLHDEIAGEFRFDSARASACAGAAWLHLGDGAAAGPCLENAIAEYWSLPEHERPWAPLAGAQVDLATACVIAGDLDAAEAAIEPLAGLRQGQRISTITGRVASARSHLHTAGYKNDRRARHLERRIADWAMQIDAPCIAL